MTAETRPHRLGPYLLVAYLTLLAFGLGAGLLESLLTYPLWRDLGTRMTDADFAAVRAEHAGRVVPLLVVPLAVRTPVTLALSVCRLRLVPEWAVRVALTAQFLGWLSSGAVPTPTQTTLLECGYSDDLFARWMVIELWFRVFPAACEGAVGLVLLARVARVLARHSGCASGGCQPPSERNGC